MRSTLYAVAVVALALFAVVGVGTRPAHAQTAVRPAWCTKAVTSATSPWAIATMHEQRIKLKVFYTAYRNYIFGIRVPVDSPIKTVADLKGKKVGVNSMGSNGVVVTRAMAANAGLDPQKDVHIVVAGEGAQAAAQIKNGQVDAYSAFDTAYVLVENAGVPLRDLPNPDAARFPSAGIYALEESIAKKREQLVALGKAYAKGQIFAMANPE